MNKILVLDNYDSFTYNLVHYVEALGGVCDVFRNDKISLEEVNQYDKIILSPGPGIPEEARSLRLSFESVRFPAGKHSRTR